MNPLHIGTAISGKPFALPLDLTTQTVAILAKKGAGKSYTSSIFNEELLDAGQIPVIIDPTGAHWGLKASADGKSEGYPVVIFGGEHADLPLEENAGEIVARAIVEQRFPAIIDLSLLRKGQVRRFITPFLETVYRLNRLPLMLVVDEADDICPQRPFGDEAQMVGALEDVVKRGRKKGIGCTLITQRPADLAKQVLTQCEMLVAMRLVHPLDIKAVMEWVHVHADTIAAKQMVDSLPSLPIGTAWFWSPGWGDIFERVQVRARKTFDSGATPKPGERIVAPKKLAEINIPALGAEISAAAERAKANDPKLLQARIRELESRPAVPAKAEVREVAIVDHETMRLLEKIDRTLADVGESFKEFRATISKLAPRNQAPIVIRSESPAPLPVRATGSATSTDLPRGERAILIGCAQYSNGATREQLTILTGYKRSSRDAYIQRLRERGFLGEIGEHLVATNDGLGALGPQFEALPTGNALLKHWNSRLPDGERKVLAVLTEAWPKSVDRSEIDLRTGYKRSSRDAYLQRLAGKRLVITTRGEVMASNELFDQ